MKCSVSCCNVAILPVSYSAPNEAVLETAATESDDVVGVSIGDNVDPSFFPFSADADDDVVVFGGTSSECAFGKRANDSIDGNILLLSNCK